MELREKHNLTYIFISHDLSVVKLMSDRMMVMNAGKVVEFGAADAIYENPQSEYTKKLIEAIPKGSKFLAWGFIGLRAEARYLALSNACKKKYENEFFP